MESQTPPERLHWERRWQETVWERAEAAQWLPLASCSPHPLVVVTAWNPGGSQLPLAVNQARDVVLRDELVALGLVPIRARGRSPAGDSYEDGWQIPHQPPRTVTLLRRYGQLAGWVTDATGCRYQWSTTTPSR
ncbi:MAG: DUF3293 domain-containing protein [Planctomycetes bacterium]|nr:DUF3293 domain-containing protein [Planctomycetota bacterium]